MATVGKIIKGKWRIDARLGSGATATVYAATHRNGYRVAVKMLHVDLSRNKEIVERFLREGYVANTIQHKGVVRVLDDDVTEDGAVFLVLELLEGESLAAMLHKNGGRLPWMQVADKMMQLLDVLSAAHAQGVVHRDVKPDNIFFTTEGVLKVLDFGLARFSFTNRGSTRTGAILGTPDFMSPEQAAGRNEDVDARSDLYAVAATAYVLMSGQSVHTADTLQEHLHLISQANAPSLAKVAPWVPFQIVGVIDRALKRDKLQRWTTAFEMQAALRAAVADADVVLVPDGPTMHDPAPEERPSPVQEETRQEEEEKQEPEEEEELLQRPDDPTRLDPEPPVEEEPRHLPAPPLAKWTERVLETAVSRQSETAASRKVPPPPPPQGMFVPSPSRVVTKFEIDDTLRSPRDNLRAPVPSQIVPPYAMPYAQHNSPPQQASSPASRAMFYALLIATALVTYAVVRHVQHKPVAPSSSSVRAPMQTSR